MTNKLRPFKFWCQKVLPLVYDNSLSYYELLCKVVDYLNNTITNVNSLTDTVKELQDFINNYFDNLDVQEEINNKLDEMVDNGTFQQIISNIMSNFLNVAENGVDNTGKSYCDVVLNKLITDNPGRTIYFPKGNYKISNPIIFQVDDTLTSYYFDSSARLYTDVAIPSVAIFRKISVGSNFRRVTSHGGIFDANNMADNCITIESLARHLNLDSAVVVNPKKVGIQVGNSDENNKGAYNIFITNCKGVGNEIPLNNTCAIKMFDTDNWINTFQCTGFDVALDLSHSSGNKISNIHIFTGGNAGTQAGFINTVGIIDGNMNVYENIYIDSFYCCFKKHSSVVSSISNLITYWSSLYNYDINSRIFDVSYSCYLNVSNCTFNKANARKLIEVFLYNDGGNLQSWCAQRRLNIKNVRKVDYPQPSGLEWNPYYSLMYQPCRIGYTNVNMDSNNAYLFGYITGLTGVLTVNIEGLNFSYDITLKTYTNQPPIIQSINIKYGEMPFDIGFGLVENHNDINFYPIYLTPKTTDTINYNISITQLNDSSTYITCIPNPTNPTTITKNSLAKFTNMYFINGSLSDNVNGSIKYMCIGELLILDINVNVNSPITLIGNIKLPSSSNGGGGVITLNGNNPTALGVSSAGNIFVDRKDLNSYTINQKVMLINKIG